MFKRIRIVGCLISFLLLFQLSACGFQGVNSMIDFSSFSSNANEADRLLYDSLSGNPNLEAVKEAIEQKANANTLLAHPSKDNALYYYSEEHMGEDIFCNHTGVDIAEYLLGNGADPNFILMDKTNLLMYSCGAFPISGAGIDPLFDLLLDAGANVDMTDDNGLSALDYAIMCNDTHKVERLLSHDAVYDTDTLIRSLTTYHDSQDPDSIFRKLQVAEMLLSNFIQSGIGELAEKEDIALCLATVKGDCSSAISYLQSSKLNFAEEIPYTASILISALNNIDVLKALETTNCALLTDHLISAISYGNYDVSIYLQEKLVSSIEALRLAVQFGQAKLTQYFLTLSDKSGVITPFDYTELDTLLVSAVKSKNLDVVRILCEYGEQYSPDAFYHALQAAVLSDQQTILSYLINEIGCDINYHSEGQMSIFETAICHGNYDVFLLLTQVKSLNLAENNTYLYSAVMKGNNKALQHLLNMGIDPNGGNPFYNPLVEGIKRGNLEAINLLIAAGADVNKKLDYSGNTAEGFVESFSYPIHEAAQSLSSNVLQTLIDSGAQTDVVDSDGNTPLDIALASHNVEILENA